MVEPLSDDEQRRDIAYHEASHAVSAHLLRFRRAGPVTIAPGKSYAGCAFVGQPPAIPRPIRDALDVMRPVPLWPAVARRWCELAAMVLLAGDVGAELHLPRDLAVPRRRPEPPAVRAVEAFERLPALTDRERRELAEAAAEEDGPSDADYVAELMWIMHGADVAVCGAHARYVEAETRTLLAGHRARLLVARLADALLDRTTLSRDAVREILTKGWK